MPNRVLRDTTDSENVNRLSILCEVFYYRLMMKADDYGSFHANTKLLKANLFPLRDNISELEIINCLNELVECSLIFLYEDENRKYLRISRFGQRLRNMRSKFPEPKGAIKNVSNPPQSAAEICNPPLETKRNEVETEIETKRKEVETTQTFFDNEYQLPYIILNNEKLYGEPYQIKEGGMSNQAIKIHCRTYNLTYPKTNG